MMVLVAEGSISSLLFWGAGVTVRDFVNPVPSLGPQSIPRRATHTAMTLRELRISTGQAGPDSVEFLSRLSVTLTRILSGKERKRMYVTWLCYIVSQNKLLHEA